MDKWKWKFQISNYTRESTIIFCVLGAGEACSITRIVIPSEYSKVCSAAMSLDQNRFDSLSRSSKEIQAIGNWLCWTLWQSKVVFPYLARALAKINQESIPSSNFFISETQSITSGWIGVTRSLGCSKRKSGWVSVILLIMVFWFGNGVKSDSVYHDPIRWANCVWSRIRYLVNCYFYDSLNSISPNRIKLRNNLFRNKEI